MGCVGGFDLDAVRIGGPALDGLAGEDGGAVGDGAVGVGLDALFDAEEAGIGFVEGFHAVEPGESGGSGHESQRPGR